MSVNGWAATPGHVNTACGEPLTLRIRGDMASRYGEQLQLHLDKETHTLGT